MFIFFILALFDSFFNKWKNNIMVNFYKETIDDFNLIAEEKKSFIEELEKISNHEIKDQTVTTPPVTTPPVANPPVNTPKVITPKVITPKVTTPKVKTPPVKTPPVQKPKGAPEEDELKVNQKLV